MKTILLNIPESLDIDDQEVTMLVAIRLYEQGKLSLGQAAQLVGITKRAFIELLGSYNISIFNFSVPDLQKDVLNA